MRDLVQISEGGVKTCSIQKKWVSRGLSQQTENKKILHSRQLCRLFESALGPFFRFPRFKRIANATIGQALRMVKCNYRKYQLMVHTGLYEITREAQNDYFQREIYE